MSNTKPSSRWSWLWWLLLIIFLFKTYYYFLAGGTFLIASTVWFGFIWLAVGVYLLYSFSQFLAGRFGSLKKLLLTWITLGVLTLVIGLATGGLIWTGSLVF